LKRREYLEEPPVNGFLSWARHLVNGERRLTQQWYSPQGRGFRFDCDSLFEAFEKYCWPMVGESKTFSETIQLFDGWKKAMSDRTRWDSSIRGVWTDFRETAGEVARWGEMRQVAKDLAPSVMTPTKLDVLFSNAKLLDPACADADPGALKVGGLTFMGAGYSKIYSLMLDDFPIYDSRVACSLTSLIRLYCRDKGLPGVPDLLMLCVLPNASTSDRDPSDETYRFPIVRASQSMIKKAEYASSNLKAAWLLHELVERADGKGGWPVDQELVALQSALFMVGYKVLKEDAIRY
jgi:hypothetical protein